MARIKENGKYINQGGQVLHQPFHDVRVHFTRLDSSGRIVLPREMREHLHMEAGDPIVVIEDENSCRIATAKQSLAEAQAYFADLVPSEISLVDSLLAERRAEASRE